MYLVLSMYNQLDIGDFVKLRFDIWLFNLNSFLADELSNTWNILLPF